jgi:iron complex transport system substrate-binding protein
MTSLPARFRLLVVAILAGLALVACGSSGGAGRSAAGAPSASGTSTAAFPITMRHVYGATTIAKEPKRVVALGWGVADAALAVGVVPVAMEFQSYGADAQGVLPWTKEKLAQLGVGRPTVLPKSPDEPPYEAIAKADPDLILAVYSGITKEQYRLLEAIAPTVAFTGKPWATPWRDVITQTATALGRAAAGRQVLAKIDDQIAEQAAAHPELRGKSIAAVWDVNPTFYVYRKEDPRVGFMFDLGLTNAPSVDALARGKESFFYTLSYEKVSQLDPDILVAYADTPAGMKSFLGKSYATAIPAVRKGAVAQIVGTEQIAAVSPPTALSLPWGLDYLVRQLSDAAKKTG